MLTIRPFRNEDPLKLLEIWRQQQRDPLRAHYIPMTMAELDTGPLGIPFFDRHCLQLAFDDKRPVGFVQVGFASNSDGSGLSREVGHIAVVAVVPDCLEPVVACKALIQAGENVLIAGGVHKIFGGSPRPGLPYYLGLYGGAEPIGIFDADTPVIEAFRQLGYKIHQKTHRFERNLKNYQPRILPGTLRWREKIQSQIVDCPPAKNWWEAISLAHCEWWELTGVQTENARAIAKVRVRLSQPGPDKMQRAYDNNWDAALTEIRVHPDFHRKGLGAFVLGEILRFLIRENRATRIEAHIAESCSALCGLLRALDWHEIETGTIFARKVR